MSDLVSRASAVMANSRYATLAVLSDNRPWTYTVSLVPLPGDPGSFIYYSYEGSRHSGVIRKNREVSGSIYMLDQNNVPVDGLQFEGEVRIIDEPDLNMYSHYYETSFPDEENRSKWQIEFAEFSGSGNQRFHLVKMNVVWLMDLEQWEIDRIDRRTLPIYF